MIGHRCFIAFCLYISAVSASTFAVVEPSLSVASPRKTPVRRHSNNASSESKLLGVMVSTTTRVRGGERDIHIPLPWAVASGVLLAFNSGYVNGCCLSGGVTAMTKQAVAAVTGSYTNSAVGFASGNMNQFRSQLGIIFSYLGGSAIAGFLNPNPVSFRLASSTGPTFLIGAVLLYLSSTWAGKTDHHSIMSVFYLAAAANGLQNSVTSVHTSNFIRSAHVSGMTSDMGTFLGQVLRGNRQNLYRLQVSAALVASFWFGGVVSFMATKQFASASLLFSACLYALIGVGLMALQL